MKNKKFYFTQNLLFIFLILNLNAINHDKWIVVTTINYPTEALKKLAKLKDWKMVVVADKKTPKDWVLENTIFLGIEQQEKLNYNIVKLLPWNHYSRKNIGYLYAIQNGAKIIYETDDDNILIDNIVCLPKQIEMNEIQIPNKVFNIYAYFGQDSVWPRGYPLNHINHISRNQVNIKKNKIFIPIQQGLVNKDPDVDAIFRLTRDSLIYFKDEKPLALPKNIFCPFNTQNTIFYHEAFWSLLIPVFIPFRVCDIWRGYIAQRLLWDIDGSICFTAPSAIQERNEHNLLKDFIDEIELYTKSEKLIDFLLAWKSNQKNLFLRIQDLFKVLIDANFYKKEEFEIVKAWHQDLINIGYSYKTIDI